MKMILPDICLPGHWSGLWSSRTLVLSEMVLPDIGVPGLLSGLWSSWTLVFSEIVWTEEGLACAEDGVEKFLAVSEAK